MRHFLASVTFSALFVVSWELLTHIGSRWNDQAFSAPIVPLGEFFLASLILIFLSPSFGERRNRS